MLGCTGIKGRQSGGVPVRSIPAHLGAIASFSFFIFFCIAPDVSTAEEAALWRALASKGHVVLLRHDIAPGTGDPPNFTVGDCSTQRNLSTEGRAQAKRIGARFRENGIETARVVSSQWCRCLDTAQLLGLGAVEDLPLLNSFYQLTERRNQQTEGLKEWLAGQAFDRPLVLVTHQVNISALTGVYPASGELVVLRIPEHGELAVADSIETN